MKNYQDKNCPFCSIITGKSSDALILYRDELVTAFLSHMPVTPAHVIIVPENHFTNPSSLPENIAGHLFYIASRIGIAIKRNLGAEGYNIISSDGFCAGQDIQHAHLHLIPRYLNDGWNLNWRCIKENNFQEIQKTLEGKIK